MTAWRYASIEELKNGKRSRLTDEEAAQMLAFLEAARELREKLLAERGGIPFPSSTDLIREMREESAAQLDANLSASEGSDSEWS